MSKLSLTTTAVTGDTPQNINFAIKLQLAKEFMSTVGLEHAGSGGTEKLNPTEIAADGKKFTVFVSCE